LVRWLHPSGEFAKQIQTRASVEENRDDPGSTAVLRISGIAVHVGARISASAAPGTLLASSTVRDLVAGSGIQFHDRGVQQLRGVPGEWRLFEVDAESVPQSAGRQFR
jgi:class 3 adenylate cyclase